MSGLYKFDREPRLLEFLEGDQDLASPWQEPGAVAGDVLLHVYSEEHDDFEREGSDLVCSRNISLMEALLGFKVRFEVAATLKTF